MFRKKKKKKKKKKKESVDFHQSGFLTLIEKKCHIKMYKILFLIYIYIYIYNLKVTRRQILFVNYMIKYILLLFLDKHCLKHKYVYIRNVFFYLSIYSFVKVNKYFVDEGVHIFEL